MRFIDLPVIVLHGLVSTVRSDITTTPKSCRGIVSQQVASFWLTTLTKIIEQLQM
jgi:hypothetical protein